MQARCVPWIVRCCLNTSWQWPWGINPTEQQLDDYMSKSGIYSTRAGNSFVPSTLLGCDVIYYSNSAWGSGTDGHFAKVVAWNALGIPTVVSSKWGQAEIIESTSYNPFGGTNSSYGAPKRYYKLG